MLDSEAWRLLWIPPSWRYYEPEGEFAQPERPDADEAADLLVVAGRPEGRRGAADYEAERRMLGIGPDGEPGSQGLTPEEAPRPVALQRVRRAPRPACRYWACCTRRSCWRAKPIPGVGRAVADRAVADTSSDVLARATRTSASGCSTRVTERCAGGRGRVDERWYWAAPILLDLERDPAEREGMARTRRIWPPSGAALTAAALTRIGGSRATPRAMTHGPSTSSAARDDRRQPVRPRAPTSGSRRGPGADRDRRSGCHRLRALARVTGGLGPSDQTSSLRNQAGQVAEGFRSLFNQPEVTVMLRRR